MVEHPPAITAAAVPAEDRTRYHEWVEAGRAGKMGYLTDGRAALRDIQLQGY